MTRGMLDPSLAFTALLEMWPGLTDEESAPLRRELCDAWDVDNPLDRWVHARAWIAARQLAEADKTAPPYLPPVHYPLNLEMAQAIARSKHPSRVLANTNGYRYGKFTERPGSGWVDVHLLGSHIATFTPGGLVLWTCGWATPSTTEALSNLVTGGWFSTRNGKVYFRRYASGTEQLAAEGANYPYSRRTA